MKEENTNFMIVVILLVITCTALYIHAVKKENQRIEEAVQNEIAAEEARIANELLKEKKAVPLPTKSWIEKHDSAFEAAWEEKERREANIEERNRRLFLEKEGLLKPGEFPVSREARLKYYTELIRAMNRFSISDNRIAE